MSSVDRKAQVNEKTGNSRDAKAILAAQQALAADQVT